MVNWKLLTTDPVILNIVKGFKLPFTSLPVQKYIPGQIQFSDMENTEINLEIARLLEIGAIAECIHEQNEFISNIFTRKKSNGKIRIILNLKALNEFLVYEHFKMEHMEYICELVHLNDWFGSIDLSDAYFSVPIDISHWKYLKFNWNGKLYCYKVLVFGLSVAPRIFTRLCKPLLAELRGKHHIKCSLYIDDMIIIGNSSCSVKYQLDIAKTLFTKLGFYVNVEKSVLLPTQTITHLGFVIDSLSLSISLPENKCIALEEKCRDLCSKRDKVKIREVSSLVGSFTASYPATKWGRLYFRDLDREKCKALNKNEGNFDKYMSLSTSALNNVKWWITKEKLIPFSFAFWPMTVSIYSDASLQGWGAHCGNSVAGGRWELAEQEKHINWLELKACWLAVMAFSKKLSHVHISVKLDNTCAISYIANMGGRISELDKLAKDFWFWLKAKDLWVTPAFIPGTKNVLADKMSRVFKDNTEWSLNDKIFTQVVQRFGIPDIDIFASRINHKVDRYISWQADPASFDTDAFSVNWSGLGLCYAFPPFSLVGKVLNKARNERAELILVAPDWVTQHWYPLLHDLLVNCKFNPFTLPLCKDTIYLPFKTDAVYPIWNRLNLTCFRISGKR